MSVSNYEFVLAFNDTRTDERIVISHHGTAEEATAAAREYLIKNTPNPKIEGPVNTTSVALFLTVDIYQLVRVAYCVAEKKVTFEARMEMLQRATA